MRVINIQGEINLDKQRLWELFTNLANYPKYIKFVQSTALESGNFAQGAVWHDWTTILYIPMKIKHHVTVINPQSEIGFDVPLIFGGIMLQRFSLVEKNGKTFFKGQISFDFKNRLLDKILGQLLQKRLQEMLDGSLENFRKVHNV